MQTLQIKQLSPNATLPTRTHATDAGLDIYASEQLTFQQDMKGQSVRDLESHLKRMRESF